jgi:hypothetical protein
MGSIISDGARAENLVLRNLFYLKKDKGNKTIQKLMILITKSIVK